jgi:hexulose-6-phosphate isomerase
MIKSISAWAFAPSRSASEVFNMARQHGFAGVEVTVDEPGGGSCHQVTTASTREECERVRDAARAAGVEISGVASGLGWKHRLSEADEEKRRAAVEVVRSSVQRASWLGVDAILCVPGVVDARAPYDAAHENARRSLVEMAGTARECGVTIAIENVWNKMLLSPQEMRGFVDELNAPSVGGRAPFGVYFDVGNVLQTGYPEQWISILGPRITRVHFKDWKRSVGTIDGFCSLLGGDVDFPAVMAALRAASYNGAVAAEFFNCEADLPAISRSMDRILEM